MIEINGMRGRWVEYGRTIVASTWDKDMLSDEQKVADELIGTDCGAM